MWSVVAYNWKTIRPPHSCSAYATARPKALCGRAVTVNCARARQRVGSCSRPCGSLHLVPLRGALPSTLAFRADPQSGTTLPSGGPVMRSALRSGRRQWGQICPFDISTRSMSARLRILCAAAASRTLQGPLLSYRSNRRLEIGSSSRRDTTAQTLRFAALLGPTTVCQMDRSDAMAPFQGPLADNWGVAGWRLPGMCRGAMFVPRRRVRGGGNLLSYFTFGCTERIVGLHDRAAVLAKAD